MAQALIDRVRALANDGFKDHAIAQKLGITRHKARSLLGTEYAVQLPAVIEIEPKTVEEFAERIAHCWRKSVEAIFEVGHLLIRAKDSLEHGEFEGMVENKLPFGPRSARMLMSVARDERIRKHASDLPPSWYTLYELTKLKDSEFDEGIKSGVIHADMERKALVNGHRSLMASRNGRDDDALDFYPTPPWATRTLTQIILPKVMVWPEDQGNLEIWEPACGEGHMSEVLREDFPRLFASDVFFYGRNNVVDFLTTAAPDNFYDFIITNPPFKDDLAERFVIRALELSRYCVAMFVRVQFLETVGRYENIFRDRPPTLIAFFAERVPLCKGKWDPDGQTATAYCWLVWLRDRAPMPPFWIPPGQRERLTRPDDRARFAAWSVESET